MTEHKYGSIIFILECILSNRFEHVTRKGEQIIQQIYTTLKEE